MPAPVPLDDLSELEKMAWEVAERAADWACAQSDGRTPGWEQMGWQNQHALMGSAIQQIALHVAISQVPIPNVRLN